MDDVLSAEQMNHIAEVIANAYERSLKIKESFEDYLLINKKSSLAGYFNSMNDFFIIFNKWPFSDFYFLLTTEDKEDELNDVFPHRDNEGHYDYGYVSAMNDMKTNIDKVLGWH